MDKTVNDKYPKITVLMPVYNAEKFLKDAIDSILNQTFSDFEFLIINDGSSDGSKNIILSYKDSRIRYFENDKNLGMAKTLNIGLRLSKGEYIARMDADDVSFPKRLTKQINYFKIYPWYDVVATKVCPMDIGTNLIKKWRDDQETTTYEQIKKQLPITNCIVHSTVVIKSTIISKYKYKENLYPTEDYELWLRLCSDKLKIGKINEELVYYRVRAGSMTGYFKQGSDYKIIQTKLQFLFGRIHQGKISIFEIKTAYFLIRDVFFFLITAVRKYLFRRIKNILIYIGIIIGKIIHNKNSSNIFFFFPFYHTGGAEKVHADIINCVKTENRPLIVFTNKSYNNNFKYLFEGNGHILDLSLSPFKSIMQYIIAGTLISQINKCPNTVTFGSNSPLYYEMLQYLKPSVLKIDLIHAFGGGIENVSLPYAEYLDYRVVENQKNEKDLYDLYESYGYGKKFNKRVLMIELEVEIPWILNPRRYGKILNFIYVGRWSEEKRVYLILDTARLCYEKKIPANFTIIGNIPKSVKNKYGKYCKFTGEIALASVKNYYKVSDFIVITSEREAFPTVVMQAMAYAVIPICTKVGNIPYHVKSWQNGVIIEDQTESDIVARILEIIRKVNKNHPLVEKMSSNASRYAAKHFGLKSFCYKYNQLIKNND